MASQWVTQREAAELLGVHVSAVPKMVRRGDLVPRGARPSLSRAAVLELRDARAAAAVELADRNAIKVRRRTGPRPPNDQQVWMRTADAAVVLGVSPGTLSNRVSAGTVPCTVHEGRRWFALSHLELLIRSQAAARSRKP